MADGHGAQGRRWRLSARLLSGALAVALASVLGTAPTRVCAAVQTAEAAPGMGERVLACTACHGEQGRATPGGYFPRIAGKPTGYLYNQLLNFRDGRRSYPQMSWLLEHLTDDYLQDIARHFAGLQLPYAPAPAAPVPQALLERGQQLVRRGDAQRDIPACTSCHGETLAGVQPWLPGLLGLSRDYIASQLGAWQTGQRRAHEPDCMASIARRLSAQDVGAIAAWLAVQPPPARIEPAEHLPEQLPLRCGGLQAGSGLGTAVRARVGGLP